MSALVVEIYALVLRRIIHNNCRSHALFLLLMIDSNGGLLQVTVRYSITPVGVGKELTSEVIEGGEGINAWQYVCRKVHQHFCFWYEL